MSPYELYKLNSIDSFVVHLIMVEPNLLGHRLATSAPNDSPTWKLFTLLAPTTLPPIGFMVTHKCHFLNVVHMLKKFDN